MSIDIALGGLFVVVFVQLLTTLYFLYLVTRPSSTTLTDEQSPQVAVLLCLRGNDPYLESCIRALLDQDYPNFQIRIMVDSAQDPAWQVVQRAVEGQPVDRVTVDLLRNPATTCSLKCSSLIQAVRTVDRDVDVIALVDADTMTHRRWLRELVAPLADPRVAVATGSRWYNPVHPTFGTLVRYVWNAAAAVQMACFQIAWGGTLAIRRSAIEQADLLKHWENGFCEDTMLYRLLQQHGLRQVFVPSLLMVNRETCTLPSFTSWATRQMLTTRLYHPSWPGTVLHGFAATVAPLLAIGLLIYSVAHGNFHAVAWLGAGLTLFLGSMLGLLLVTEWFVSRIVSRRDDAMRWPPPATIARLPIAIVATLILHPLALLAALFLRHVRWRGIQYRINGPARIRLEQYVPYSDSPTDESVRSL